MKRRLLLLTFALCASSVFACGPMWKDEPSNQFDGVNERGEISWWKKIGEVDFGNNSDGTTLKLPLIVNFKSSRETTSPLLGKGWLLSLLESHFVPFDDNGTYLMVQPDGHNHYFFKSGKGDSPFVGSAGWVAEVKGNVATAWADCGWKLRFLKGKLDAIFNPQGRRLDIVRENGKPVAIRENSDIKLQIEYNGLLGEASALVFPDGSEILLTSDMKPKIERLATGELQQTALERSLSKITFPDEAELNFRFGKDETGNPSLTINDSKGGERIFAWDPETRSATRDGGWTYAIIPGKDRSAYAAIKRTNKKGQSEFWYNDTAKGVETTIDLKGVQTVSTRFVAGKTAGKLRKVEEIRDGKTSVLLALSYGPDGKVARESTPDGDLLPQYDDKGRIVTRLKEDGTVIWRQKYDEKNRLVIEETVGKRRVTWEHLSGGGYIKKVYDPSSGFGPNVRPADTREYDSIGRNVARLDEMGVKYRYHRDEKGRIDGVFYAGMLLERTIYDKQGRKEMEVQFLPQSTRLSRISKYSYEADEKGKIKRTLKEFRRHEIPAVELAEILTSSQQFSLRLKEIGK